MLKAEPVREYLAKIKRLNELLNDTPSNAREVWQALKDKLTEARQKAGLYPAGLIEAVNKAMLGQQTGIPEMDELAHEIIHRPEK